MTSVNIYNNLLAQFNRTFRHNRQGSFKTRERYQKAMKRFCRFLSEVYRLEKLANIAPKHIHAYTEYMQSKGLSASTIKTDLAAIRFWHDQIPNPRHNLPANNRLSLERRAFGKVDRAWTSVEFNKMIGVCWHHKREDYVAIICLGYYAGLRIHECFRIGTSIAMDAIQKMAITVKGKGGKIRTVPINESIRIELAKMLEITPLGHKLFISDGINTHTAINQLQQFIRRHKSEVQPPNCNKPMTFHGLRHAYALEQYKGLIRSGDTEVEARLKVSKLLGHERADVTKIYLAGLKGGDNSVR